MSISACSCLNIKYLSLARACPQQTDVALSCSPGPDDTSRWIVEVPANIHLYSINKYRHMRQPDDHGMLHIIITSFKSQT